VSKPKDKAGRPRGGAGRGDGADDGGDADGPRDRDDDDDDAADHRATATARAQAAAPATRGDRSKRLLDLVMLLLGARQPVTFREIREQFAAYQTHNVEAGLRAFERDKADLLELGVPIRYVTPDEDDSLEDGGYVIDLKRYRLPEVKLTPDEISALVLAASVARAVPGGSYPKIVDLALKKLAFDMPDALDTPMALVPRQGRQTVLVHFPEAQTASARAVGDRFADLETATRNRKRVTLKYQDAATGMVTNRDVDPYALVYREKAWLLVGYCHLRKDLRSFRVDRVLSVTVAPKPKSPDFERPANFDARAYANRSPWTFQIAGVEPEEVVLEIRAEAADIANEDFGADGVIDRHADGTTVVRFVCSNPEFVALRVLAAKGSVLVRTGAALRTRIAAELAAISAQYDEHEPPAESAP
jgi:proteasome accessory factor B